MAQPATARHTDLTSSIGGHEPSVSHGPADPWALHEGPEDRFEAYLTSLTLIERLHRQLLDVIKHELDRVNMNSINSVQALLLFNIGDAELTAGELRTRGHYLGSNVSYNLKKLVDLGYLRHERSEADRRSVRISLTRAGQEVRDLVHGLFERHMGSIREAGGISDEETLAMNVTLRRLERFWLDQVRYRL